MDIDAAYEVAQRLVTEATANLPNIKTEEDAKLQIITRMLTEVLGWFHSDISTEHLNPNGFSDYELSDGKRKYLVLEAKKIGVIEIGTHSKSEGHYKISGPVLRPAFDGIEQAASYCHPQGIQLAVLTDGLVWIVFLPWVPQESYTDKQAIVFPCLEAVLSNFATFFELLSKSHLIRCTFRVIFDRIHENRLVLDRALESAVSANDNRLIQKSALAFDLENVFVSFFRGLAGENDPDMLIDCFVETRESRIADFSLEKITKNVLGNIDPGEKWIEKSLQTVVQNAVAGDQGQTVFIVGPSGAGKSTFLDRFFARTLEVVTRQRCVVIDIDALDASGDEGAALAWMTQRAIQLIEAQLFEDGIPNWNDLQGLYQLEYIRRSKGVDAQLYTRDKGAFKEKFSLYVDEQVERDREGYLRRLLRDIVNNRKKLPIFIVDNTDEFLISFKISIFQYFQALRRETGHCLLIFPVTDKSAWSFSKTDIFNIYSSKSFFLPTPSPREVFRKRIDYLKVKLQQQSSERDRREYFSGKGIRITIDDLAAFAAIVERIFVDQDYASKRIGELSNYNIRKILGLSQRVITSAALRIEDLIRSYITGTAATISQSRFMNALLKGDYELFRPGDEPLLFSLFQVDSKVKQSPLVHVRILILLRERHVSASEDVERYISIGSILSFFDLMGLSAVGIQLSIEMLLNSGLIETYDPSKKDYSEDQRVAITYSGIAHLEFGLFNPIYFEQMALTTRIGDPEAAAQIRAIYRSGKSVDARLEEVRNLFCAYLVAEDSRVCAVPQTAEFRTQSTLSDDLSRQWRGHGGTAEQMLILPELAAENVEAFVEWFDSERGFGFVNVPSLRDNAFLHAKILEQSELDEIHDGDDLICDISRNEKGLVVSRVREVAPEKDRIYCGEVIKLLRDRHYGFMYVEEIGADALFLFHLFSPEWRAALTVGQRFSIQIKTDDQGRSQVRRVLDF